MQKALEEHGIAITDLQMDILSLFLSFTFTSAYLKGFPKAFLWVIRRQTLPQRPVHRHFLPSA